MYDENNVTYRLGINWKDIIIKIILVVLFIILLLWLFPRNDLGVFYDSIYTNNINTMKDAAEKYYVGKRLPINVGESTSMSLKEMIDNKMLIRFTDKDKNYCDENASGVQVTKNASDDYVLKVHLVCGKDDDYILETLSSSATSAKGTNSADTKTGDSNTKNTGSSEGSNENGTNGTNSSSGSVASTGSADEEDYSMYGSVKDADRGIYQTSITMYQHRKAIYYSKNLYRCPAGYTLNGTKCYRSINGSVINATPIYSDAQTIIKDAKVNGGEEHIEYADPIKTRTGTNLNCPEGYTKNGAYCIKYTDATETKGELVYSCKESEGYKLVDKVCKKTYTAKYEAGAKKYSCPNGGELSGSNCVKTEKAIENTTYSCPSGYNQNGSSCYKAYNATAKTTYSCPTGYTLNGDKCTSNAKSDYNATAKTTYSCASGTLSGDKCVSTESTNATAKVTYSCASGTLSGSSCVTSSSINATANTTYACASGTLSGTKCTGTETINATAKTTYSCSSGTLSGSKCKITKSGSYGASASTSYGSWAYAGTYYYTSAGKAYTGSTSKLVYDGAISGASCGAPCGNKGVWYKYSYYTRTTSTKYSCPNGGTLSGTTCKTSSTSTVNATAKTTYSCPSGYTLNGTKCNRSVSSNATPKTTYSCPSGYTLNGTKCTTSSSTAATAKTTYSCPNGGTLNGTKCNKSTTTTAAAKTTYSCPNGGTLNGTKCSVSTTDTKVATPKSTYSCPDGGTLDGTKCVITISGTPKIIYSCPSGYSLHEKSCSYTYVAKEESGTGAYTCPDGGTLNGTTCTITKEADEQKSDSEYSCPNGGELEGNKCKISIPASGTDTYVYTCPEGFTASGEGENTVCSKTVTSGTNYYCEEAGAILNGTKCTRVIGGSVIGYTCPAGYKQNDQTCTKDSVETINATVYKQTSTSYKYIWSEKSYLDGWEFTGKTKTVTRNYTAGQR